MRTAMTVSILDRRRRRSQEGSRACGRGRRCRRFNPRSAPPPVASPAPRAPGPPHRPVSILDRRRRRSQAEEVSRAPVPPGVSILDRRRRRSQVGRPREPLTNEVVSILDRRRRRSQARRPSLSSRPCPRCFNPRSAPPPVASFPVEPGTSIACMFQSSIGAAAGRKSRRSASPSPIARFQSSIGARRCRKPAPPGPSRCLFHLLFRSLIGAAAGRQLPRRRQCWRPGHRFNPRSAPPPVASPRSATG